MSSHQSSYIKYLFHQQNTSVILWDKSKVPVSHLLYVLLDTPASAATHLRHDLFLQVTFIQYDTVEREVVQ